MDFEIVRDLAKSADTKIVLLVMDGLGGIAREPGGPTELEAARTPNLDRLAAEGICGLHEPIGPGIVPGSGPSHLALFGYNPFKYQVGRGVLAALGTDFDLQSKDVAARGNFCTVDSDGNVTDRRAGRISSEKNQELCALLRKIKLPGAQLFVQTVKEHRFLLVLRGEGLAGGIRDTDPQAVGRKPIPPRATSSNAQHTAKLVEQFLAKAGDALSDQHPANMVLLRGSSQRPMWPTMKEVFGVRPAAVAGYPMYRGVAKLVGMEILETGPEVDEEMAVLKKHWSDFDFFYFHVKGTDSAGEDGDFDRKVALIEEVDARIPDLMALEPEVAVVTGDHSTPSVLKSHSWHPVPVVLWSKNCRADRVRRFGESDCVTGGLTARFPGEELVPLALANAGRLEKFGA